MIVFRRGDVIRFRRGNNEYLGTIYRASPALKGCIVTVKEGQEHERGAWTVRWSSIVRIEVPVLTEKEREALIALRDYPGDRVTVKDLAWVRLSSNVTGSCLSRLEKRGFVAQSREGLTGLVSLWALTGEGRRVAKTL